MIDNLEKRSPLTRLTIVIHPSISSLQISGFTIKFLIIRLEIVMKRIIPFTGQIWLGNNSKKDKSGQTLFRIQKQNILLNQFLILVP